MQLIKIEKLTGAKRLYRKYFIDQKGNFEFSQPHEMLDADTIEFEAILETEFKAEIEEYRPIQKAELSKIARTKNTTVTKEIEASQGTKEWLNSRIGIITASKTPFDVNGNKIPTYDTYVNEKVAEAFIFENDGDTREKYQNEAMQIGTDLEIYALERYTEVTGQKIETHSLLISDDLMIGASPDGVTEIDGKRVNIEVKSVLLHTYIGELFSQVVTKRYHTQVQVQMYILNCDTTHLVTQTQERTGEAIDIIISIIARDEEFVSNMIATIKQYEKDFEERYSLLESKIIVK